MRLYYWEIHTRSGDKLYCRALSRRRTPFDVVAVLACILDDFSDLGVLIPSSEITRCYMLDDEKYMPFSRIDNFMELHVDD